MEEMRKLRDMCELGRDHFCSLVISTAETYMKSDRWSDAVQLINYTAAIQGQSSEPIISQICKKISKDAIGSLDVNKALKVLLEMKNIIEKNPYIASTDKCSIYNNLACAFRRSENLLQAKKYIDKALVLVNTQKVDGIDRACTFLNSCTILSALEKHFLAADHAKKALEIGETLEFDSVENKTVLGMSYFNYAVEKFQVKDLGEAEKYYAKCVEVLKNVPNMESMVDECKKNCELLKLVVSPRKTKSRSKSKGKKRPFSANIRGKVLSFKVNGRDLIKKYNLRGEKQTKALNFNNKTFADREEHDELSYEVLKSKRKELQFLSRPPSGTKKVKIVKKTRINDSEVKEFRISSQTSIKILPLPPQTEKLSNVISMNPPVVLEITSEPGFSVVCVDSPEKKSVKQKDLNEELEKRTQAAVKIQKILRGRLIREKMKIKIEDKVIYRAVKTISHKDYLVIVLEKLQKKKFLMKLMLLPKLTSCFKIELRKDQTKDLVKLIQSTGFTSEGIPFIKDSVSHSYFTHVQRKVKKISGENYILDCFSNDSDLVMIKAKKFESEKEFSMQVQGKSSSNLLEEIDTKILPKLRIREDCLILSQSGNFIPKLLFSQKKKMQNEKLLVGIYEGAEEIVATAKGNSEKVLSLAVNKKDFGENTIFDEDFAKRIWKKVNIIEETLVFDEEKEEIIEKKEEKKEIVEKHEEIEEEPLEKIQLSDEEPIVFDLEISINQEKFESHPEVGIKIVSEIKSLPKETLITLSDENAALVIQRNYRKKIQNFKDFSPVLTLTRHYKILYTLSINSNRHLFKVKISSRSVNYRVLYPISQIFALSGLTDRNEKTLAVYLSNILYYFSLKNKKKLAQISAFDVFANKIKANIKKFSLARSRKRGLEPVNFEHQHTMTIGTKSYSLKTEIYETYLQVLALHDSESLKVYMKSHVLRGYPADFPMEQILKQHIYPRLYIKSPEQILHGIKKFEISAPIFLSGRSSKSLLSETTQKLNGSNYNTRIIKGPTCFEITCHSQNTLTMHLPIKDMKNYPNANLICTHILLRLHITDSQKLCLYEENKNRMYMNIDVEINSQTHSVSINKELNRVLIHAYNIENGKDSLLFLENLNVDRVDLEKLANSLKIVYVNNEVSLILDGSFL